MSLAAPRRVALVVGQLQLGGAERQLFELAVRLDRSKYLPFVVCLSEVIDPYASLLRARGVDVAVVPRRGHRDPGRARRLGGLLADRGADLAHSFLIAANAYTYAACRLTRLMSRSRPPYIASSRTCIPPVSRWDRLIHRRAFRSAAAVIANSRRVMQFTRDLYGVPEGRFRVIPNGVDMAEYPAPSGEEIASGSRRAAARAALGLPASGIVVGTLGRLSAEKNLGLFLEMAARLSRQEPSGSSESGRGCTFVIVGDGPMLTRLRQEAARLGMSDRVVFAGARQDVPRVLPALDIFALSSDTEGLPNAVMEAMAAGLPVVATRVGGTEEVVAESRTGFLVPPGDAEALADRVGRLAREPGLRLGMGLEGHARIAAEFSVTTMVARTVDLYDEVLA